jgi:hypothetical protein
MTQQNGTSAIAFPVWASGKPKHGKIALAILIWDVSSENVGGRHLQKIKKTNARPSQR